jgi:hypothetical protein
MEPEHHQLAAVSKSPVIPLRLVQIYFRSTQGSEPSDNESRIFWILFGSVTEAGTVSSPSTNGEDSLRSISEAGIPVVNCYSRMDGILSSPLNIHGDCDCTATAGRALVG